MKNYQKRGKLIPQDFKELFIMFAMKRKIKLMSRLINDDDYNFEFTEDTFLDVIENEVFDMAVLLYREYFLKLNTKQVTITNLLVGSFYKPNG